MCDESVDQLLTSITLADKVTAMQCLVEDIQQMEDFSVVDWHRAGFYTGLTKVLCSSHPEFGGIVDQEFIELAIEAVKHLGAQEPMAIEFMIQLLEAKLNVASAANTTGSAGNMVEGLSKQCHPGLILFLAGIVEAAQDHVVKELVTFLLSYFTSTLSVEQQVGQYFSATPNQSAALATLSIVNASLARPRANSTNQARSGSIDRLKAGRGIPINIPKLEFPNSSKGEDRGMKRGSIDILDPASFNTSNRMDQQKATPRGASKTSTKQQQVPAARAMATCGHKIGQLYATLDAKTLLGMKKEHEALVSAEKTTKGLSNGSFGGTSPAGQTMSFDPEIIITAPEKGGEPNPFAGFGVDVNSLYQKVLAEFESADDPLQVTARMVVVFLSFYSSNLKYFDYLAGEHFHLILSHEICAVVDRRDNDYLGLLIRSARKQSLLMDSILFRYFQQPVSLVGYPVESIGVKVPSDPLLQHWVQIVTYLFSLKPIPWDTSIKWYLAILAYYLEGIASSGRSLGVQCAAICIPLLVNMLDVFRRNISFTMSFATILHYFLEVVDALLGCYTIPSVLLQIFTTMFVEMKGNPLTAFLREYTRRLLLEDPFTLFGLRRPQEVSNVVKAESPESTLFLPEKFDPILHLVRLIRHFRILGALSQPDSTMSHGPASRHFFVSMGDSINQLLDFLLNPFEGAALALLSQPPSTLTFPLYIEMLELIRTAATGKHSGFLAKSKWVGTYTRFLYLSFLISYNSETFTQEDPVTVRLCELTLSALSTIVRVDQHARHKAAQLGIVNTLVHEVDLEHTVKDLRERHIRRSTVGTVVSEQVDGSPQQSPKAGGGGAARGVLSPSSTAGDKFLTPNSPMKLSFQGTKNSPSHLTLEAGEARSPKNASSTGKKGSTDSGALLSLSSAPVAKMSPLLGGGTLGGSDTAAGGALAQALAASAGANRIMSIPKLSLGNVPAPMYYTSNGDTAAAAEAVHHTPDLGVKQEEIAVAPSNHAPYEGSGSDCDDGQEEEAGAGDDSHPPVRRPETSEGSSGRCEGGRADALAQALAASAGATRIMSIPKLSLGNVPAPMYYTSNGDTAAAAEAVHHTPDLGVKQEVPVSSATQILRVGEEDSDDETDDDEEPSSRLDGVDNSSDEEGDAVVRQTILRTGSSEGESARSGLVSFELVGNVSSMDSDISARKPPRVPQLSLTNAPPPSFYTSGPNEESEEAKVVERQISKMGVGPPKVVTPKTRGGVRVHEPASEQLGRHASLATTNSDPGELTRGDPDKMGRGGSMSFKPGGSFMVDHITYPPSLLQNESRFTDHQRRIRRIYVDVDVQVEILFLLMQLIVNPNGSLEELYLDSYTFCSRKINILFYIETHLNHISNKNVAPKLAEKLLKSPNQGLRVLFQLLCAKPTFQDTWTSGGRIGKGAFGVVLSSGFAIGGNECKATANLQGHAVKIITVPKHIDARAAVVPLHTEVLIMIQNRDLGGICELVDFGNDGNAYRLVMKKYSKSLTEWRQEVTKRFHLNGGTNNPSDQQIPVASSTSLIPVADQIREMMPIYLSIFMDVLGLVEKLHFRNVAHYDIKCDNIFMKSVPTVTGERAGIFLGDFGESEIIQPEETPFSSMRAMQRTSRQKTRGTEAIRAPECLVPHKFADRRRKFLGFQSDSWSLGCLLFELVTGTHLFHEEHFMKLVHRVTNDEGELLEAEHKERLGHDPFLISLLQFILTRDPGRRPLISEVKRKVVDSMARLGLSPVEPDLHPLAAAQNALAPDAIRDTDSTGSTTGITPFNSMADQCSIMVTSTEAAKLETFADFVDNTAVLHDRPSQFFDLDEVASALVEAEKIPSEAEDGGRNQDQSEGFGSTTMAAGTSGKSKEFDAALPHVIFMPHRPSVQSLYEAGCTHCITFGNLIDVQNHFHTLCLAPEIKTLVEMGNEVNNSIPGPVVVGPEETNFCRALVVKCVAFIQNTVVCNGQCVIPSLASGQIDLGIVVILIYISVTYSVPLSTCMAHVRQVVPHIDESVALTSCVRLASCCLRVAKKTAHVFEETYTVQIKRPVIAAAQALQEVSHHPFIQALTKDRAQSPAQASQRKPTVQRLYQCLCGEVCYELEPHEYTHRPRSQELQAKELAKSHSCQAGPMRDLLFDTSKGQVVPEDVMPHDSISEYYIFLSEAYNSFVLESVFPGSKVRVCNVKKLLPPRKRTDSLSGAGGGEFDPPLMGQLDEPTSGGGGTSSGSAEPPQNMFKKWKPLNLLQLGVTTNPTRQTSLRMGSSKPPPLVATPEKISVYEAARGQRGGWIKAGREWRCRACRFPTHWESVEGTVVATHCALPVRHAVNSGDSQDGTKYLPPGLRTPPEGSFVGTFDEPSSAIPMSSSPSPPKRGSKSSAPSGGGVSEAVMGGSRLNEMERHGGSLGSTAWYSKFHLSPIIPNAR